MAAGLFAIAGTAQADITSVDGKGTAFIRNYGADIKGNVTCTHGDTAKMDIQVKQVSTQAKSSGYAQFLCSGKPQGGVVPTFYTVGTFAPGPAEVCVAARTGPGGEGGLQSCDTVQLTYPT
jgi:phosphoglycolate phosphatase-like HAD superfamily hydrolase